MDASATSRFRKTTLLEDGRTRHLELLECFSRVEENWFRTVSYTVEERISNQENGAVHRRESYTQGESVAHAKLRHT